jgi:xanthine dehydrogenase YagS FAD-binding subunit
MRSFEYWNPRTVAEACELLADYGSRARIIAGGTDLLGQLKDDIFADAPETLVNIKGIAELGTIRGETDHVEIGALVTLADIAESALIRNEYPALADAARSVAASQIRNMGTLGGNLCQEVRCWYYRYPRHLGGPIHCLRKGGRRCPAVRGDNRYHAIIGGKGCFAACPSDTATALATLDATVGVAGTDGRRDIPVVEFYTPRGTVLRPSELLTEIRIPRAPEGAKQAWLKFTVRKPVDFALVSVASALRVDGGVCTDARIALGAVAPVPVRAVAAEELLRDKPLTEATVSDAAAAAVAGAKPLRMNGYKVELTRALIRQALLA